MGEQILDALRPAFPDVEVNVALERLTDRYNGYVLSQGFKNLSFVQRQSQVFALLREHLGAEAQRISMLFTYTPDEYKQLQAA